MTFGRAWVRQKKEGGEAGQIGLAFFMTNGYKSKINEALEVQKKYLVLIHPIWGHIGKQSNFNPNFWVYGQAKNYIFASGKLSGQILEALENGHLQLGVVGSRTLFEMAVNATYINSVSPRHLTIILPFTVYRTRSRGTG